MIISLIKAIFGRRADSASFYPAVVTPSGAPLPNSDIIKGYRFVCALDEDTCLECLEHDGTDSHSAPPLHPGCRCVRVPVIKSWEELAGPRARLQLKPATNPPQDFGSRASAIGPVPDDGGVYKTYLVERARAIRSGLDDDALLDHLLRLLGDLNTRYPHQVCQTKAIEHRLSPAKPRRNRGERNA